MFQDSGASVPDWQTRPLKSINIITGRGVFDCKTCSGISNQHTARITDCTYHQRRLSGRNSHNRITCKTFDGAK